MQGYIPSSDDFMFQDPEQVDTYCHWQPFTHFLETPQEQSQKQMASLLEQPDLNQQRNSSGQV